MEVAIAAASAVVTWVSSAAAVAVSFLAAPMVGALGEGMAILVAQTALKVTASALGSLAINAVMAPRVGSAGSPTSFKADPSSPIRGVMGRFGTAGTQNHMRVWGKNNLFISYSVILSLGPIQGIAGFEANKIPVEFPLAQGEAAQVEPYRDKMWMTYKMGLPTDGSLGPPIGISDGHVNLMTEWTPNHRTSGYAGAFWTMKNNSKRASYEGGVPKPMWTVLGMKLYDPRKDSTQTEIGGNGPHRINDWRTWEFSENPHVHAYNWAIGHFKKLEDGTMDRRFLLAGVGSPANSLALRQFVAAANVADQNNWKIAGEWNTQDDKWQVFTAMLQAGGGVPTHSGAKIGVMVNAPKTPVATITSADIIGNMNIKVMASRRDRFNTIFPRYLSEAQDWEYATAGAVSAETYLAEDRGEERPKEITYNYVPEAKQVGQLAAYDLANTRETLKVAFPSKPHLLGVQPGDAVIVNVPENGLANQKFLVMARPIELAQGTVSFELRSETDAKHAWALGQTAQPAPSPSLTSPSPIPSPPEEIEWVVLPSLPAPGGTSQPGIIVTGNVPDGIGSVLVEYSRNPLGPWESVYSGPPTSQTIPINGLEPLALYYVRITYISVAGVPSEPRIFGPIQAGDLVARDSLTVGGFPVTDITDRLQTVEDIAQEVSDKVDDLEAAYGDTASAAASAAAAALSAADAAIDRALAEASESAAEASAIAAQSSAQGANTSAIAAAGSASTANTKATEAGQSADAASAAKVLAETARSQAQAAQTQAAQSETNAAGSASAASQSASLASGSQTAAGQSADAASGSASTANTKANEAGVSAAAAAASQVSAAASRDQALAAAAAMGRVNLASIARIDGTRVSFPETASGWGFTISNPGVQSPQLTVGPLKQNVAYSISFKARRTAGAVDQLNIDLFPDTLPERVVTVNSATWVEYKLEDIASASADMLGNEVKLRFFRAGLPAGSSFDVTDIKLEEGATASAWSPSPKDAAYSASAAATSAASASASDTSAGEWATSAQGSATTAGTQAGYAETFAGQASGSAADANTASISSGVSATTARKAAQVTMPSTFEQDSLFFATYAGSLIDQTGNITPGTGTVTYPVVAGVGKVVQVNGFAEWGSKGAITLLPGRTHRASARVRVTANGGADKHRWVIGFYVQDANGNALGQYWAYFGPVATVANGWQTIGTAPASVEPTTEQIRSNYPSAVYIRPYILQGWTDPAPYPNSTSQVAFLKYEDITESVSAASSAAVATQQQATATAAAASASTSATLAASVNNKSGFNIVRNSTFAEGYKYWNQGVWQGGNPYAPVGPHAFCNTEGTNQISSDRFIINANLTYTLSADFRALFTGGNIVCDVQWEDAAGNLIGWSPRISGTRGLNFGDTDRKSVTFTPPAGTTNGRVRAFGEGVTGLSLNGMGVRQIKLEVGDKMTSWRDDTQITELSSGLSITSAVTADLATRMATAQFEVIAAAGGNAAQLKIRADSSGSLAALVAQAITFSNTVNGAVVKVMEIVNGSVFITGVLIIGTVGGGRIEINGPGMRIDVFDETNTLRMRMGKLS